MACAILFLLGLIRASASSRLRRHPGPLS